MPSKRATTDVWTIRNTQDMRSYIDEMEDAVNDLQMLVWDSAHDRARRRVEAPEFFDCLAHLTWAMEMLLTFTESKEHPQGALGYGLVHLALLAHHQHFHRLGHPMTMDDLHLLERVAPQSSFAEMANLTANVQRILGIRGENPTLE